MKLKLFNQFINEGKTGGDCYPVGGRLIMEFMSKGTLVHGMVSGQGALEGMKYGHCWVEVGNKVYDYSNGKKIKLNKNTYYALGKIDSSECKYYSGKESMEWMVKTEHWGPWEMSGDPIMTEDIPDTDEEVGKKKQKISGFELRKIEHISEMKLKSYEQFILEKNSGELLLPKRNKWLKINPNSHKELSSEFFDLIQIAYSTLGGHAKVKSPGDVFGDSNWTFWQGVDLHDSPDLDLIIWGQHTKYGVKFSGVGHDGKKPSTREYLDHKGGTLKKKGFYGEVSGKLADIMLLKYNVKSIDNEKDVEKLLGGKDITWHGKHPTNPAAPGNGWYDRKLGNRIHTKIMIGNPKGI